jgi:16S rRNA (cytidine1402-2'-O)-methyltransferase
VLYEAPHRLARTLDDLVDAIGSDRKVVLARELTKLYEEIWRGDLAGAVERCSTIEPRGEYVVILEGAPPPAPVSDDDLRHALRDAREGGASTKDAVAEVADRFGAAKKRVYALATTHGQRAPNKG